MLNSIFALGGIKEPQYPASRLRPDILSEESLKHFVEFMVTGVVNPVVLGLIERYLTYDVSKRDSRVIQPANISSYVRTPRPDVTFQNIIDTNKSQLKYHFHKELGLDVPKTHKRNTARSPDPSG